ncbi:MAG TPA: 1-deoxy-D-xylulose-5-phosphate reductoisomerase [bacterium]|nr:1-deoxy-D-xylulose-5-phosphate reductoisomerase [bacterium]
MKNPIKNKPDIEKRLPGTPARLTVLGSTGSIGVKVLETARELPGGRVEIESLAARTNWRLLKEQAVRRGTMAVCLSNPAAARALARAFPGAPFKILEGAQGLETLASAPGGGPVFNAIAGIDGLRPSLAALRALRPLLMANKESLVAGGRLLRAEADLLRVPLIPVDSEHSAIFQCLSGRDASEVRRVVITASGGPFLKRRNVRGATPAQATAHPVWPMGPKVSVDSATLMNKGLELIEAAHLFGLAPEKLSVAIHPQCVVHAMVELADGSIIAHLAPADMKTPIRYALTYPERLPGGDQTPSLSLSDISGMTFAEPDEKRFPCLTLARAALARGGLAPAALNAADEVAVSFFLSGKIDFANIPSVIEKTMSAVDDQLDGDPMSLEEIMEMDAAARKAAKSAARAAAL